MPRRAVPPPKDFVDRSMGDQLTDREADIMRVLWERGPSSVAEVGRPNNGGQERIDARDAKPRDEDTLTLGCNGGYKTAAAGPVQYL